MKNNKNRKIMQLTRRCLMYLLVMITVISAVMPGAVYAAVNIFDPGCVLCKVGNCSEHCTGDASTCKLLDCPIHQGGGTGTYSGDQSDGMVAAKNSRAGGYPISQDTYDSQRRVYWDITVNKGTYQDDFQPFDGKRSNVIESVTLNNTVVKIGNSGATPNKWGILESELTPESNFAGYRDEYYGTGDKLATYYPGAYGISAPGFESAGGFHYPAVEETKTLRITPKPGWKVVTVIVACTSRLNSDHTNTVPAQPYDCCTFDYGRGEAFFQQFTAKDGALTLNLPSKAFGHLSNMNPNSYFILIEAEPDPNYVSYGSVKVVKNVNSTSAADLAATYTFKAEYFDANGSKTNFPANAVLSGDNSGNESLANKPDYTFTLKRNGTATISGLPIGSSVKITENRENLPAEMTVSYNPSNQQVTSAQNAPTLTVTNSRADGSVKVKKIVNSTSAADMAATYTFMAEYIDVNGSETNFPANARLSGANSGNESLANKPDYTFTLKHNGIATISGLPVGSKVLITETKYDNKNIGDSGMTVLYSTTDQKVTSKTGAETLEVTNKRDTATLSVTKNVNSSSPADKTDGYPFEAKYIDVDGIVKDFPDGVKVTIGSAVQSVKKDEPFKFTLKHGQTAEFSGLPAGSKIKVTETTVPDGMTATDTGTKDIATGGSWTVTNSRANGSVKVQKVVKSSISADLSADYSFEAKYIDVDSDTNENFPSGVTMKIGTGTPVNVPSDKNDFSFILKHDEIAEFSGLPIGSKLQITETEPRGMKVIYNLLDKKVESAQNAPTLTVTNERTTEEATVTKFVESTSSVDLLREYRFTARFMDENGNTGVNFPGGVTVKIGSAEAVPVPDTKNDYSFTLTNGQSAVFSGLPKDSAIVVTENDVPENITVTVDGHAVGPNGVTILSDSSSDSSKVFTNTRPVADVVVKKTVTGGVIDTDKEFRFTATLKDSEDGDTIKFPKGEERIEFTLKHNGTYKFENLPVGAELTIVEVSDENYTTTNDSGTGATAVYVVKQSNDEVNITYTNDLKNGSIIVEKEVEQDFDSKTEFRFTAELYFQYTGTTDAVKVNFPASAESDNAGNAITFNTDRSQATFTLKGGEKAIFKGLPVGSILKVQEENNEFYTTTYTNPDGEDPAKASLQVTLKEGNAITYTNTRKLGGVKISKTVVGNEEDADKLFEFEAILLDTRKDPAETIPFPDSIREIDGVELDITKKKVIFSLKHGQSITLTGLQEGTVLRVIEKEPDFFDVTVDPASGEQAVDAEELKEINFTNTRQLAPVTVKKEITGEVIDPTIAFTFTAHLFDTEDATDPIPFPQTVAGDTVHFTMSADNKTATFTLHHNETITFPDLYVGSKLVIDETRDDRFDPSNNTESTGVHAEYVIKPEGENETITYTNKLLDGSLKILKTVTGPIVDKEQEFEFTATLWKPVWDDNREPDIGSETGEQKLEQIPFNEKVCGNSFIGAMFDESVKINLSADKMTVTFTLKHEDVAVLQKLPIGSVVKVSETAHRNYETTNSITPDSLDAQMMVLGVDQQEIEYTNSIKTTSLTIDKTVTGNLGEREREFSFTVTMKDKYGNALDFTVPDGITYDAQEKKATFTLKHDESIVLTEIPVGAIVTVQEDTLDYEMSAKLNGMEKFEGEKQDDPELKVKDGTAQFHVVDAENDSLEVINHKDVKVDTGIALDSLPWILVLAGVAAAAAVMFLRRRRYDED